MKHWQSIVWFALAATCGWSGAQTPTTPAIQVLGEATGLSFSAAQPATEVWIQVKVPDGLDAKTVKVDVQGVLFDKKPDLESLKAFTTRPELVTIDIPQPTIVLKVSQIDKLLPGPYAVTFRFSETKSPPAPTTQKVVDVIVPPLAVVLERRAAQIAPLSKQVVDLTLGSDTKAAPASIRLTQQSDARSSQLRGLSVSQGPFSKADGTQVAGKLSAELPASAAAGEDLQMRVAPTDYPVGSSTGKVFIKSFDLKEPYTLEVEVRTKRHIFWLFFWVVLGLVVGHVLRVVLQGRLEKATATNAGAQLLLSVEAEKVRNPDKVFYGKIEEDVLQLKDAIRKKDVAAITTNVAAVNAALKTARSDLVSRLQRVKDDLVPAAKLGRMMAPMPSEMGEALREFQGQIEMALEQVDARDAVTADETRLDAIQHFGEKLKTLNGLAVAAFKQATTELQGLKSLLNDQTATGKRPETFAAIEDATGLAASGELADLDSVRAHVNAWRDAGRRRAEGIAELATFIEKDADNLVSLAKERSATGSPALDKSAADAVAAAHSIAALLDSLVRRQELFSFPSIEAAQAHAAYSALVNLAAASHQNLPPQTKADLDDLVRKRSYAKALDLLPQAVPLASNQVALDQRRESLDRSVFTRRRAVQSLSREDRPVGARFVRRVELDSPRAIEGLEARTALELATLSWVQTLGVAAVLAGASYALFGERFVGTCAELVGLFFWGFTTNLTVAKLTELSGPLAAKPKP